MSNSAHPEHVPAEQSPAAASPAPAATPTTASPGENRRGAFSPERAARTRMADRALNLLLLAAERDNRVGLSVTVGGVVIAGTLIGSLAYYRALADQFASAQGGTTMDERLAASFSDLVDEAARVAQGDRRQPPDPVAYEHAVPFLHLEEARYISPAGVLPSGRHGVLWRCPVSEVSAWSLGDLVPR